VLFAIPRRNGTRESVLYLACFIGDVTLAFQPVKTPCGLSRRLNWMRMSSISGASCWRLSRTQSSDVGSVSHQKSWCARIGSSLTNSVATSWWPTAYYGWCSVCTATGDRGNCPFTMSRLRNRFDERQTRVRTTSGLSLPFPWTSADCRVKRPRGGSRFGKHSD